MILVSEKEKQKKTNEEVEKNLGKCDPVSLWRDFWMRLWKREKEDTDLPGRNLDPREKDLAKETRRDIKEVFWFGAGDVASSC